MVANYSKLKKNKQGMPKMGWTRPPSGLVKLNTDAAVNLDSRRAASGSIVRDASGQFLAACRVEIDGVLDVATAEAQAFRDGLRLVEQIGCNKIYIETDSLEVVNALADPFNHRTVGTAFLDECRLIMAGFESTRLAHCPREANKAAHLVARTIDENNVWFDEPPAFLYPQLVDDVTDIA
ncbi:hypothetical protein ACQ4PT_024661 [Festuca glaucescens]